MARYKCPSCGEVYNGKKCRNCLYEHFTEEIAHGNHTHEGEPLVIDAPVRKPLPRKNPFGCEPRTRKKNPTAVFVLLLAIVHFLMPVLGNLWNRLEAAERPSASITAAPEPVLQPENMVIFHQEDGITIFTSLDQLIQPTKDFSLYVHNESDMAVTVSAGEIRINGIDLPHAALVCKARPGEIGKGWLQPDAVEWEASGIQQVHTLSFDLGVIRQDGRLLFKTGSICLSAEGAENT